jgi:hypothetical protein
MTPDDEHVPRFPFFIFSRSEQSFGVHSPTEHRPNEHFVSREMVVPHGHDGEHDSPCSKTDGQSPIDPLLGNSVAHEFGWHMDALDSPNEHMVGPDEPYPALHCM